MTTKRAGASGSIEAAEGGGFWARMPRDMGRKRIGWYPTREAAAEALAAELERYVEAPPDALTVAAWGKRWLDERDASGDYRSVGSERDRWRDYVEGSPLGRAPLERVQPADVRRWLHGLSHLAAQTRRNALTLVRGALRSAVDAGYLETDPTRDVRIPRAARAGEKDRWTWLTASELEALLAVRLESQRTPPERWQSIWTVAAYSGLRPGELWALRWDDVVVERGVIAVRRAVGEKGKIGPPKGGQAREVPLLAPARTMLEAWRAVAPRSPRGLVWPSEHGGGHHRRGYRARFRDGLREAGIERRVRFYDLRHTCASHLLQGTWAPWIVARALRLEEVRDWLGHADVGVTQRYAHLAPDGLRALVPQELPQTGSQFASGGGKVAIGGRIPKPWVGCSNHPGDAEFVGQVWGRLHELALRAGKAIRDGDEHRDARCLDLVEAVKAAAEDALVGASAAREEGEAGA